MSGHLQAIRSEGIEGFVVAQGMRWAALRRCGSDGGTRGEKGGVLVKFPDQPTFRERFGWPREEELEER